MHSILQSVEPVPQLQDLPGGGLLYVTPTRTDITPTFTEQLRRQLEQALVDLTARSCCGAVPAVAPGAQPDAGTAGIQQQDITVSPVVNNEFPSDVVISLTQHDGQPGGFHIIVRTLTGKTLTVRVYPWMKMKQVIISVCSILKSRYDAVQHQVPLRGQAICVRTGDRGGHSS